MGSNNVGPVVASAVAAAPTIGTCVASADTDRRRDHTETQKVLDQAVAAGLPGIVVEVHDGHRTWFGSAGVSDSATGRERSPDEQFRIGSATKAFVATVVQQLAAEHRLSLDDTVDKWLPGVVRANGNDGRTITIRQLLNQTSHIPNPLFDDKEMLRRYATTAWLEHRFDTISPERITDISMKYPPHTASNFWYSNTNYVLAARVIEKVTGSTYAEQVNRRVIRPLGLTRTYVPAAGERTIRGPHPIHYSKLGGDTAHDVTEVDPSLMWASGDMVSTTTDMLKLSTALRRGTLLPPAQHREMWTTVDTTGSGWLPDARYGAGGVYEQNIGNGITIRGTGGGINGSFTFAVGVDGGDRTVVIHMNGDWVDPLGIPTKILQAEFGRKN